MVNNQYDLINDVRDSVAVKVTITHIAWEGKGRVIAKATVMPGQAVPSPTKYPVRELTIIGAMHNPIVGGAYTVVGDRVDWNSKYRTCELRFSTYNTEVPDSNYGAIEYLAQIATGIGRSYADKIISKYGPEGIQILKNDPNRVANDIKGLSVSAAEAAADDLRQNEAIEHATIEVHNILSGVLPRSISRKAVKRWGSDAPHIIKQDPFELTALRGVAFVSADVIHGRLKHPPDALGRHVAAVAHLLNEQANRNGSTIADVAHLELLATRLVGELHPGAIEEATNNRKLTVKHEHNGSPPRIQLRELAEHETEIAARTIMTMNEPLDRKIPGCDFNALADEQKAAAEAALANQMFILTGAPGTGKTFTTARIIKSFRAAGLRSMMCAPTGKAAKQLTLALSATCGGQADTIHSTLGACYDEEEDRFGFRYGPGEPLETDVLLIDEFSMVPVALCRSLFDALLPTTRVIIIGDRYQLPSVGPGAVLRDMLAAGVPSAELREIRRNAGDIVRACHDIKDGKYPDYPTDRLDLGAGHNWRHIDVPAGDVSDVIEQLVAEKLPRLDFDPTWDVQVISPTNERGSHSCSALNRVIKGVLNPSQNASGLPFSKGDKIVRLKNGQAKGATLDDNGKPNAYSDAIRVVNGDIGVIKEIDDKHVVAKLLYPNRLVKFPRKEHHLRRAYCMTCHKMQGSEVPVVVMPLTKSIAGVPLVTREWIYTAFSRAKKVLITVGDKSALHQIIGRIGTSHRQTTLQGRIESALASPARTINARNDK